MFDTVIRACEYRLPIPTQGRSTLAKMVCMNTSLPPEESPNNERLKALVTGAGLTQAAALALFNRGIKVRPLALSTWKGYFCKPGTSRYRGFAPELLAHAEKVFGPLQGSN